MSCLGVGGNLEMHVTHCTLSMPAMKLQWAYKLKTEDEKTISTLRKVRSPRPPLAGDAALTCCVGGE